MMPIKIECGCGQRFAFDVEPVNGQMPAAVACPSCGADATPAANQIIAQQHTPLPVAALAPKSPPVLSPPPIRVTVSPAAPAHAPAKLLPGQVSREQAEHEARAKIMWGDSEKEVIIYLRVNGFSTEEAQEIISGALTERAKAVREAGIRKIFTGIGLICVPIVAFVTMASLGVYSVTLLGIAGVSGVIGLWTFANGVLMALAPKSEKGEINED